MIKKFIFIFILCLSFANISCAKNFIRLGKSTPDEFIKTVGIAKCDGFCPNDQDEVFKQATSKYIHYAYIKDNTLIIASTNNERDVSIKKIDIKKSLVINSDDIKLGISNNLFVLKDGVNAIGVISSSSEMYSGGGASFESIDLIEFSGEKAILGNYLYNNIPFSCNKLIRACFSEEDYKQSKHCHDESYGILKYYGGNRRLIKLAWQFTEHPSQELKKYTYTDAFVMTPQDTNIANKNKINFCSGD